MFLFLLENNYLLQIQPYDICLSKSGMDLTAPSKTMLGNVVAPVIPTKTEAIDNGTNVAVPDTALMEISSRWYDVDLVEGTKYTVTGYSTKLDSHVNQVRCGFKSSAVRVCPHLFHELLCLPQLISFVFSFIMR